MVTWRIISGSRLVLSLMGRVWFNCNRVYFLKFDTGSSIVISVPIIFLKYFIFIYFIL